jgi:hypothetical protein
MMVSLVAWYLKRSKRGESSEIGKSSLEKTDLSGIVEIIKESKK